MLRSKSLGRSAVSFMLSSCVVLALNFASGVLTARTLSVAGRGEWAAINIWVQNLGWVFALGFTEAIQFYAPRKSPQRMLTLSAILAAIYGILGVAVAEWVLPIAFRAQSPQVLALGRVAMVSIALVIFTEYSKALLAGRQEMRALNINRIGQPTIYVAILIGMWLTKTSDLKWVVLASYGTGLLALILTTVYLAKTIGFGPVDRTLMVESVQYGSRVQGGNMAGLANKGLDLMVLPAMVTAVPLGLYSLAGNLSNLLLTLVGSLSIVLLPEASRRGTKDAIRLTFRATRIALIACTGFALIIGLGAPKFISFAYGHEFLGAVLPLRVLLLGAVFLSGGSLLIAGLQGIGEPKEATRVAIVGFVVTVVGLAVTLKPLGIMGAAYTSLASYATTFAMAYWRLRAKSLEPGSMLAPVDFASDLGLVRARLFGHRPSNRKARTNSRPDHSRLGACFLVGAVGVVTTIAALKADGLMPAGQIQVLLVLGLLLPSLVLALLDSWLAVPYILSVWIFGPEVRRIFDAAIGQYQNVTIISLAPMLATLPLIIPIVRGNRKPSPLEMRAIAAFAVAIAYGVLIGGARNGAGALFDAANYVAPFIFFAYLTTRAFDAAERQRWISSFVVQTALCGLYGIYQFVTCPEWDAFWMRNVPMASVSRHPEALNLRVFSTLNSAGPAGFFFATALGLLLLDPALRRRWGIAAGPILLAALALTQVRTAWLLLAIVLLGSVLFANREKRLSTAVIACAVMGAFVVGLPYLPGGDILAKRLSTFGQISGDDSLRERSDQTAKAIQRLASQPWGEGLGSLGQSQRIAPGVSVVRWPRQGHQGYNALDFDNGFLAIFISFGVVGGALLMAAFSLPMLANLRLAATPERKTLATTAVIFPAAVVVMLASGNNLVGVTGVAFWLVLGLPAGQETSPSHETTQTVVTV